MKHICQNCERVWTDENLNPIPERHLQQRVRPGEIMPSGECPHCHAVCHQLSAKLLKMQHAEALYELLVDVNEWAAVMGGFEAKVWRLIETELQFMRYAIASIPKEGDE